MTRAPGRDAPPRAHFVDLLRLVMAAQMIQGHTLDALLGEDLRQGAVFEAWTWVRGLTAVGFLFAAGVSFSLSSLSRWEAYRAGTAGRRRVRRALTLVGLGYLLHAPAGVLSGDAALAAASLRASLAVDVLQCIGVTMLVLEGIAARASRPGQVVAACGAIAALAIGLAPWTTALPCEGPLRAAENYVSRAGGSLFPLLPWSGFLCAGVVVGALALRGGGATSGLVASARLAGIAVALGLSGRLLEAVTPSPRDALAHSAWPAFSLVRLAAVTALSAVLAAASARVRALPRAARVLAGETLVLYMSHLLVLYAGGVGLAHTLGRTLSLSAALGVAVALAAGAAALALGWAAWRTRRLARVA